MIDRNDQQSVTRAGVGGGAGLGVGPCVALYARVSTDAQARDGTVDSQVEVLRQRASADGLGDVPESMRFVDDGYSGSTLVRPALERLRDAAASRLVSRLYVLCPDRLARNFAHQMVLGEELAACGVELTFADGGTGAAGGGAGTPEEALLRQVQGVVAEYERAKILERCRRGRLHAARSGQLSVMARAAYGYRYVSKAAGGGQAQMNVELTKAAVVQEIFAWAARDRLSLRQIARRLGERSVASPGGKAWRATTVAKLLRNPVYKGRAAFGKRALVPWAAPLRPRRGSAAPVPRRPQSQRNTSPDQWVFIAVPVIVDAELFDAAGRQLAENRKRMRGRSSSSLPCERYLLAGLTVCAQCGYAYCGRCATGHGRHHAYYRCGSPTRDVCANRSVRAGTLDERVWQDVRALLAEPQRIEREYQRRLGGAADAKASGDPAGAALEARARRAQSALDRLIDAFAGGLLERREFEPRLLRARQDLDQVRQEQQSQIQSTLETARMRLALDQLDAFAQQVAGGLADADWQTRRRIIRMLVRRVEVDREEVRIVYRVDPPPPFAEAAQPGRRLQDCPTRCTEGRYSRW